MEAAEGRSLKSGPHLSPNLLKLTTLGNLLTSLGHTVSLGGREVVGKTEVMQEKRRSQHPWGAIEPRAR